MLERDPNTITDVVGFISFLACNLVSYLMTDLSTEEIDLPSRSQLKRENQELRDMGEQLVLLAKSQLEKSRLMIR